MRAIDTDHPLSAEIQQEMAASYFAACKKMVAGLAALRAFDDAPESRQAGGGDRRSALVAEAAELVYFVVVQREALQLSGTEEFFRQYDVPSDVRTNLGLRATRRRS